MYSFYGSLVERPHPIRGGGGVRVQSQAKTLYLNLGSLHLKIKKQAV
jgi:hypothetical protein